MKWKIIKELHLHNDKIDYVIYEKSFIFGWINRYSESFQTYGEAEIYILKEINRIYCHQIKGILEVDNNTYNYKHHI